MQCKVLPELHASQNGKNGVDYYLKFILFIIIKEILPEKIYEEIHISNNRSYLQSKIDYLLYELSP
jgi:hypothetical protein